MRRVAEAGVAWMQGGREEADLLRGARLEAASEWAAANAERLSSDERDFVAASTAARDAARARERRNTRRLRRLVAGVSMALAVALVAGAVAVAQRSEATDQRNRAQTQSALAASTSGKPPRRHATQPRTPGLPGQVTRRVESLTGSAPRARGRSTAPGRRHIGFARGSRSSQIPGCSVRCTRPRWGTRCSAQTEAEYPAARRTDASSRSTPPRARPCANGRPVDGPVFGGLGALGGLAVRPEQLSGPRARSSEAACASWQATASRTGSSAGRSPLLWLHARRRLRSRPATGVRLVDVASGSVLRTIQGPPATILRSAATAPGWPSRPASGTSPSSMRRPGQRSRRGDTPASGVDRVERDRHAARRRGLRRR